MGRRTFSMRWLNDGSVKLSKNAPPLLQKLVDEGHLKQGPLLRQKARPLPRGFLPANQTGNEYGVELDQVWESMDPRDKLEGQPRQVRVVALSVDKVLVENLRNGKRTSINMKRFSGRSTKGFKRVLPLEPPAFVQAEA